MKRIQLLGLLLLLPLLAWGQLDTINVGTTANDGTGESLRSAFLKANIHINVYNAAQLYRLTLAGTGTLTLTTTATTDVTFPTSGTLATTTQVAAKVNIADTASMLTPYIARGDTAAMLTNYALSSELANAGTSIGDVRDEIADSLNVLRPLVVMVADTAAMLNGYQSTLVSGTSIKTVNGETLLGAGNIVIEGGEGGSMTNPMTTAGDIVIGGASGVPSRLAAGAEDYVLTISSGVPAWAASSVPSLETRIDSIVTVLADTMNIEELLLIDLDADTVADLSEVRLRLAVADTASMLGNYTRNGELASAIAAKVNVSDTASMLSNYLLDSETAASVTGFTPASGSLTLSGADALTFTTTAETNVTLPTSGTLATTTQLGAKADTIDVRLLADTIPIFVFGLGSGVAADTAVFNDNAIAGAFYNAGSDTLMITSLRGVLAEGTGTETIGVQVSWHATFKSGSATNLNASAYTVTSITTGDEDTSFAASTIPPGVWVWCTLSGTSAGNRPSLLILTMSGYRQNRAY